MTIKPQSDKQKDRIVSNVNILNSDIGANSVDSIVNQNSQQPGQNQRRLNKSISGEQNVVTGTPRRLDVDYEDLASRNHHRSPNKSNHRSLKRSTVTAACSQHHFSAKIERTELSCQHYQKKFQSSPKSHTQISTCAPNQNSPQTSYEYKSNSVKTTNSALHPSTSKLDIDSHDSRTLQQKSDDEANKYSGNSSVLSNVDDENVTGYNSGDEYMQPKDKILTTDEWEKRDDQFKKSMFKDHRFQIETVGEDGACLFRAISLQIYGDQEMHEVIRQQTMDYIFENREYFAQFVTEDILTYINRKRNKYAHGNHIEIQAISEIYNRPIELYCYNTKPFNIFNPEQLNNGYEPLRLSYQRNSHYNAIIDPYNHTVGIGLGLAGYKPESQTQQAMKLSEQLEIEHTMFEDKLKTTDWDATNDEIVEQIARESYIQWCRDNQKLRTNQQNHDYEASVYHHANQNNSTSSATITSSTASTSSKSATVTCVDSSEYLRPSSSKMHRAIDSQSTNLLKKTLKFIPSTSKVTKKNYKLVKVGKRVCKPKLKISQNQDYDSDSTDLSCKSDHHISYFDNTNPKMIKLQHTEQQKYSSKYSKTQRSKSLSPRHYSNSEAVLKLKPNETKLENEDEFFSNQEKHKLESSNSEKSLNKNYPVSKFYQSLLESSYRDDGLGQLTENEMVLKGIEQSRLEYIKTEKIKRFSPTNSNFENYRYKDNLSMYFTLDKDST